MQASNCEQAPSGSVANKVANELDDAVCIDPFAPRKIPHYEYKMPSSSSTHSSSSDLSDDEPERRRFSYQTASVQTTMQTPMQTPMQSPMVKLGSEPEKRYYTGAGFNQYQYQYYTEQKPEQDISQVCYALSDFLRDNVVNGHSTYDRRQEQPYKSRRHSDRDRGLAIDESVIEETRHCLRGLRRTLDKGRNYASSDSVYDWNCRVEQFLEGNLDHAVRVNSAIRKRKR